MKKILLIIIVVSFSCKAQDNSISSKELTINNSIILGGSLTNLTLIYGDPIEIEKSFSEMDEVDMFFYKYNGINFTIKENTVSTFRITSNKFNLTKHNIKIGDNISILKSIYPLSYENKINDGITLVLDDMDMFLVISYNNNIIDKIALYTY